MLRGSDQSPCLTAKDVAEQLSIKPDTVRALAQSGKLDFVDVADGSKVPRYRFTQRDVDDFERMRSSASHEPVQRLAHRRQDEHVLPFYDIAS